MSGGRSEVGLKARSMICEFVDDMLSYGTRASLLTCVMSSDKSNGRQRSAPSDSVSPWSVVVVYRSVCCILAVNNSSHRTLY